MLQVRAIHQSLRPANVFLFLSFFAPHTYNRHGEHQAGVLCRQGHHHADSAERVWHGLERESESTPPCDVDLLGSHSALGSTVVADSRYFSCTYSSSTVHSSSLEKGGCSWLEVLNVQGDLVSNRDEESRYRSLCAEVLFFS